MNGETPTIGGDPEFFIYSKKKDGSLELITADKVLPGKHNKLDVGCGEVFFDGVQAEINPYFHECREFFARDVMGCLNSIYGETLKKYPDEDIEFAPLGTIDVTKEDLKGTDDECKKFGCSPDYNIYGRDENFEYPDAEKYMKRFSGGHVHLGFHSISYMEKMKTPKKYAEIIRLCDLLAGTMAVAISDGEEEVERRKYYGLAGTYRIQTHGIEYRTLSSFWMVSPPLLSLFTGLIRDAFTISYNGLADKLLSKVDEKEVVRIINTSDVNGARKIYKKVILPFYRKNPIRNSPIRKDRTVRMISNLVYNGYRKFFEPTKMLHYWHIKNPHLVSKNYGSNPSYYGIVKFSRDYKKNRSLVKKRLEAIKEC
jgi:hypothetical protein